MTAIRRASVRPARRRAAAGHAAGLPAAFLVALAALGLAACGPEPEEVDRSPVAGMTEENPDPGDVEDAEAAGARNQGTLTLAGGVAYDGPAAVECGPTPIPAGHPGDAGEDPEVGRLAAEGEEPQVGEEPRGEGELPGEHGATGHAEPGFAITLSPAERPGVAITLHLPAAGEAGEVPIVVAAVGEDGGYRESRGTATVTVDDGSMLTRSSATDFVSGSFTGRYRGEAGDGEARGEFVRCYYFD